MAGPLYIADPESAVMTVALDGLSVLFHEPSGMTHIVAPPAPEILAALQAGPADAPELLRRLRVRTISRARRREARSTPPGRAEAARAGAPR